MDKLEIKAQSLPSRCAVCHQTDCFDPLTNYCSRCAETEAEYVALQAVPIGMPFIKAFLLALGESIIGAFTGGFVGVAIGAVISVALQGAIDFEALLPIMGFIFTSLGTLLGLCILEWNIKTMLQAMKDMLLKAMVGAVVGISISGLMALVAKHYQSDYLFLGVFWGWFLGMFIGRMVKLTYRLHTTGRE